jgi:geranylgeranyl pyrophosphate synthase
MQLDVARDLERQRFVDEGASHERQLADCEAPARRWEHPRPAAFRRRKPRLEMSSVSALPRPVRAGTAHRLHPYEKSFGYYMRVGYAIASGRCIPQDVDEAIEDASNVDTAILIIDDIIDESATRAGRPCMYREIGLKDALAEAMVIQWDALSALHRVMELLDTPAPERVAALECVNELHRCIYIGQRLDLAARRKRTFSPELIDRYFELIGYATSSHVRTGMEVGQLLAGCDRDPDISAIADDIGVIRQICDDFNDYFPDHHDPFADFNDGLNRLPELLFRAAGGRREDVLALIERGRGEDARAAVLTPHVRSQLHRYCRKRIERMERPSAPFDYSELTDDIGQILTR